MLLVCLVKVVLVQDEGVGKDVAQQPRQCRLAAGRASADADNDGLSVDCGHGESKGADAAEREEKRREEKWVAR